MDAKSIDMAILNNKGNVPFLDNLINELIAVRNKLDWQIAKFLEDHCKGVRGIELTDLDASSPIYRFYNAKTAEYNRIERTIRVAEAYKK